MTQVRVGHTVQVTDLLVPAVGQPWGALLRYDSRHPFDGDVLDNFLKRFAGEVTTLVRGSAAVGEATNLTMPASRNAPDSGVAEDFYDALVLVIASCAALDAQMARAPRHLLTTAGHVAGNRGLGAVPGQPVRQQRCARWVGAAHMEGATSTAAASAPSDGDGVGSAVPPPAPEGPP
ncbi:hypothetical protein [Kocuria rosea]|uniref:hypothetical protein n=1 Tax=Kocuria rosea TaxID=1275 RepID=UPI00203AF454|nr:hypothetical protein [Kocuria rosea]MCM3687831.1 hypothetical protein [Kocuria rosea]